MCHRFRMVLLQVVVLVSTLSTIVEGLQCWHCIADDCSDDPSGNYKATEKLCIAEQACQKVYFEMLEETERGNFIHTSTVRGCSSGCKSRNDFSNCTHQQRTSRGCVRKDCCSDTDLCNSANTLQIGLSLPMIIMIFAIEQAL
ncbi:uncharacterized protein LOC128234880 isoform X1 [Mya arenaria]|uniref:uncharacterized protein LOC128234880 isoform X1 n=1 Tax=Mya arenaria TaxID=6604 RepID=UPI0022E2136E|nr:uncharacterized protein LOC128234880 isoform X1 [Mya arenaria]